MDITIWSRFSKKHEGVVFNHISNGYDFSRLEPVPKSELQRSSWTGQIWISERAQLIDNRVIAK